MGETILRYAATAALESQIRMRFEAMKPLLNERTRRIWAATEAKAAGPDSIALVQLGGSNPPVFLILESMKSMTYGMKPANNLRRAVLVSRATGICRATISRGCTELDDPSLQPPGQRIRHQGAGAIPLTVKNPALLQELERMIEPTMRGDPESPLRWTCKSTRNIAEALQEMGHKISHVTVATLLHSKDYSLQANCKILEGADHPDRDAQFAHINETVQSFIAENQPAISVDTKKKELVGNFKNSGREWEPQGCPKLVDTYDFPDPFWGKVAPYGVFDMGDNSGWVSVGIDHDTASFTVESIRRWWNAMGKLKYPGATQLLITADSGGSNGARVRLWKVELQKLADETGLCIHVCHLPPGTSKWNQIEHRLFSFISMNWRGEPL